MAIRRECDLNVNGTCSGERRATVFPRWSLSWQQSLKDVRIGLAIGEPSGKRSGTGGCQEKHQSGTGH